ncbi:MAG: beta-lactamase family protein [Gammaproteobacteria bacterium]|nr:beta-lactamase family protein [Gammaproteobacteria bacterium]
MTGALILSTLLFSATTDIQAVLDRMRIDQELPGVSAVITYRNTVIFAGASGMADLETARAMTADTIVYAGSLSKVLTAVLTLQLVEDGKLSLSDRVDGIATQSSIDAPDVTISHLLTHASGLEREGDFGYWFTADFPDRTALERYLRATELRNPPGTSLHYSNIGYAKLGLVIEDADGRPYADALLARVLDPLGMTSTGAPGPIDTISSGYTPVGRVIPNEDRPFAGVGRAVGNRHIREYHDAKAMSPAFGIYTSANDLSRLTRFLLGHGGEPVLSTAMRQRMRTRQASGWGLGLKLGTLNGRSVARHEGWFAAHRSHLLLDVDADISVVVMTNSDSGAPAKIAEALYEAVLQDALDSLP